MILASLLAPTTVIISEAAGAIDCVDTSAAAAIWIVTLCGTRRVREVLVVAEVCGPDWLGAAAYCTLGRIKLELSRRVHGHVEGVSKCLKAASLGANTVNPAEAVLYSSAAQQLVSARICVHVRVLMCSVHPARPRSVERSCCWTPHLLRALLRRAPKISASPAPRQCTP